MIYSYSSIRSWLTCPKNFEATYILKNVPKQTSPAMERGSAIHKACEDALNGKGEPPTGVSKALIGALRSVGAQAETRHAITADGRPCEFFAPDAWLRGVIDVEVTTKTGKLYLDWKTGGFRPDPLQADVYATLGRARLYPDTPVEFQFYYIDQQKTHTVKPDAGAASRVKSIVAQVEMDTEYEPTPGWLCRFCPVMTCKFNKNEG